MSTLVIIGTVRFEASHIRLHVLFAFSCKTTIRSVLDISPPHLYDLEENFPCPEDGVWQFSALDSCSKIVYGLLFYTSPDVIDYLFIYL